MITVKLKGGLGNQLFQYSFGRLLSHKNNQELKLDTTNLSGSKDTFRQYALDVFNINAHIANNYEIASNKYPLGFVSKITKIFNQKILRKYNIGYNDHLLKSKSKYFEGYFQNHKYLEPIRDILLSDITLKESIEDKYKDLFQKILENNSVSIHIRRGDYVNDKKTKKAHYVFGLEYYQKAIQVIKERLQNPIFFIFSDDIDWVKQNLKINEETYYVSNDNIKDYEELIIMSKCKHNIIANSSFSFWGAWLNQNKDKIVIAPHRWNNKFIKEYRDLLPEDWIKI